MSLADRLRERMEARRLGQSELARAIGVTQGTIAHILSGRSQSSVYVPQIARKLGTTAEYLLCETDDPNEGALPIPTPESLAEQLDLAPLHEIDLGYGMGAATYLDVPVTSTVRYFSREWISGYTKADPRFLLFAQGLGDSMMPTLHDQDLLLIDTSQKRLIAGDRIWAIAFGEAGMIKRLRPMPDGSVRILSDNPSVPDQIAYDGEMNILGRVVAVVRKM